MTAGYFAGRSRYLDFSDTCPQIAQSAVPGSKLGRSLACCVHSSDGWAKKSFTLKYQKGLLRFKIMGRRFKQHSCKRISTQAPEALMAEDGSLCCHSVTHRLIPLSASNRKARSSVWYVGFHPGIARNEFLEFPIAAFMHGLTGRLPLPITLHVASRECARVPPAPVTFPDRLPISPARPSFTSGHCEMSHQGRSSGWSSSYDQPASRSVLPPAAAPGL